MSCYYELIFASLLEESEMVRRFIAFHKLAPFLFREQNYCTWRGITLRLDTSSAFISNVCEVNPARYQYKGLHTQTSSFLVQSEFGENSNAESTS